MIRGSCLCGAVAFELDGELMGIQLCHAARCRKATGAAYAPELLGEAAQLRWTRGAERVRTYRAPLLREPPAYVRAFCETCGSPMPAPIEGTPYVGLNPGVLDDDPGARPALHAFVAQAACWHEIADGLPRYDGRPPRHL